MVLSVSRLNYLLIRKPMLELMLQCIKTNSAVLSCVTFSRPRGGRRLFLWCPPGPSRAVVPAGASPPGGPPGRRFCGPPGRVAFAPGASGGLRGSPPSAGRALRGSARPSCAAASLVVLAVARASGGLWCVSLASLPSVPPRRRARP